MKKIFSFLLCLFLLSISTISIYASDANETKNASYWSEKAKSKAIKYVVMEESADVKDLNDITYFAYHLKDDIFFEKILDGAKLKYFIDDKEWDFVYIDREEPQIGVYSDFDGITNVTSCSSKIDNTNFYTEWNEMLDAALDSEELGKIKNVSFLSYSTSNVRCGIYAGDEEDYEEFKTTLQGPWTYNVWFAYIKSNKGEFLMPYDFKGNTGLENGKVYGLSECAEIMTDNVYVVIDRKTELVDIHKFRPWVCAGIFAAVILGIGAVIIVKKKKHNQVKKKKYNQVKKKKHIKAV